MKTVLVSAALGASVRAAVANGGQCCFHLTATGAPGGPIGQLEDGQNRIGDHGLPQGQYCIGVTGGLIDSHGRGCILTPPTTQWQCDAGVPPTPGFSLSCNGTLSYHGDTTFYTCPTGQNHGYNIYDAPLKNEPGCKPVFLQADRCFSGCVVTSTSKAPCSSTTSHPPPPPPTTSKPCTTSSRPPPPPPSTTSKPCTTSSRLPPPPSSSTSKPCTTSSRSPSPTSPSTSKPCTTSSRPPPPPPPPTSKPYTTHSAVPPPPPPSTPSPQPPKPTCPGYLEGAWEFPHLIVPMNTAEPHRAYGTIFNGTAGGSMSSVFNFDIPQSAKGKMCTLEFLFPEQWQLETSSYTWSGPGSFNLGALGGVVTKQDSFSSMPKLAAEFGTFTLKPGTKTIVGSHECPAGKTVSFWLAPADSHSSLNYFQDYNPCPIGFYITIS